MKFGEGYFRDNNGPLAPTAPLGIPESRMSPEDWELNQPHEGLKVSDIGMSVPLGIAAGNVEGVSAKIRQGMSNLELGFPGAFHGNRQAHTPGIWGKEARTALRELAKANDVTFTTHAAYNVMGLSGQDQQGNFSSTQMKASTQEVQRAIEFAADTAGGGSVVVHTGEFERPITHIYPDGLMMNDDGSLRRNYARDPKTGRLMFRKRNSEAEDFSFQLMDQRTGQVMQQVQGDRLAAQPVWMRSKEKKPYHDKHGNLVRPRDYIDYDGNLIDDPYQIKFNTFQEDSLEGGRVPEYDPKTGRFRVEYKHHDDFEREAQDYNNNFKKIMGRNPNEFERMTGREMFMKSTLMSQAAHARGWALQYGEGVEKINRARQKLMELRDWWTKKENGTADPERWKLLRQDPELMRYGGDLLSPELKMPTQMIDDRLKELQVQLEFSEQSSIGQDLQGHDTMETMRNLITPEKWVQRHGVRSYAEAAYTAFKNSKDPRNPLVLTLENIFPDRFAGHPEEFKWLIGKVRNEFADLLTKEKIPYGESSGDWFKQEGKPPPSIQGRNPYRQKGMTRKEAEKAAEKHIKMTLDTGHLNMWRKYWQDDPSKTSDQNNKEFHKWYLKQIEGLAKEGLIGNVHLVDNFGYQDEHLAPGQGNAPIREVISILKKYGYDKEITVEPGADATTDQGDFWGVMKTWRHLGLSSSIYGSGGGPTTVGAPGDSWTNIQHSYFGQGQSPYFVYGGYAPSNDWQLWSQVPLE